MEDIPNGHQRKNTMNFNQPSPSASPIPDSKKAIQSVYGSRSLMILSAIGLNNVEAARKLALSHSFIESNQSFLESGELLNICFEKGLIDFAQELIESGYKLFDNALIKAIKENTETSIETIIRGQFYPKTKIELEYWLLLHKDLGEFAESLKNKEKALQRFTQDVLDLGSDLKLTVAALKAALERGYDDLACAILKEDPLAATAEMIKVALETKSIDFLRRIWIGNHNDASSFQRIKERLARSSIWENLNREMEYSIKEEAAKIMKIGYIIRNLLERNLIQEARKVINWPEAADDKEIFQVCVEMNEEELGRDAITKRTKEILSSDFELCFNNKFYWLAIDMLEWDDPLAFLYSKKAQVKIVELLANGSTCYFAAEFFSRIKPSQWCSEYTEQLCELVGELLNNNEELHKCPYPILFLVLIAEFCLKIASNNIYHMNLCKSTADESINLARFIEDAIEDENELLFFTTNKDSTGRTVLEIISINGFFVLLENNDVGSIINNLWIGERKNEGILKASTIYTSATAPEGSSERLSIFNNIDSKKSYMFQYDQLLSSCKMRFYGQIVSVCFLVFFYSMMVEFAHTENTMDNFADGKNTHGFLRLSQIWIVGIFLERILINVFCYITKRNPNNDSWTFVDIFMFIMMIFLMAGVNKYYAGDGTDLSFISSGDFNLLMHSVVLCLVWMKLFSILVYTESYGPLLRMMYIMTLDMVTFLIVYFASLFLGAVMMTVLFHGDTENGKFDNFGIAFQTLYRIGLGDFDTSNYLKYKAFGAVLESCYSVLTNVLLFNVLIAVLSVTYEREIEGEDFKFRATLVNAYSKWKWDQNYGLLVMMPSPITIFTSAVTPLLLLVKTPSRVTNLFSKIFFILFVLPMFAYFAALTTLYIPLAYIASLDQFAKDGATKLKPRTILQTPVESDDTLSSEDEESAKSAASTMEVPKTHVFSYKRAIIWLIVGPFIIVWAYLRDLIDFWRITYKTLKSEVDNNEDPEGNILLTQGFIKKIQKTLNSFTEEIVSVDDVINAYIEIDNKTLGSLVLSNTELMESRKSSIETFVSLLSFSRKKRTINRLGILEMLPKKNYYSQNYISRAKNIRVLWISKALKQYRAASDNVNIKEVDLPRTLIFNETYQIRKAMISTKSAKKVLNAAVRNIRQAERTFEED